MIIIFFLELFKLKSFPVLAILAQWILCQPENQRVSGSIPVRSYAWVAGQVPSRGRARGNHTLMFLSLSFSLPSLLSKNKFIVEIKKKSSLIFLSYIVFISPSPSTNAMICSSDFRSKNNIHCMRYSKTPSINEIF